jgi:hypothetical protein
MSNATGRRRKPKALTPAVEARYSAAKPDDLGNLHERMKAVIERAQEINLSRIDIVLWHHLFDLQTEVSFHEPALPPYGHRHTKP